MVFTTDDIGRSFILYMNSLTQYEVLSNLWKDVWGHTIFIKDIFDISSVGHRMTKSGIAIGIVFEVDLTSKKPPELILKYMRSYYNIDVFYILSDKQNYTQVSFKQIIHNLVLHKQYEFYKGSRNS